MHGKNTVIVKTRKNTENHRVFVIIYTVTVSLAMTQPTQLIY